MPDVPESVRPVLQKLALWPEGREFFDRGPLECVSVVFGVRPDLIEQARAILATDEGRDLLEALGGSPGPGNLPPEPVRPLRATPPASAGELLERARRHELGVRCLVDTPVETAAVLFGASPFLVLEARRLLHEEGIDPEPAPDSPSDR